MYLNYQKVFIYFVRDGMAIYFKQINPLKLRNTPNNKATNVSDLIKKSFVGNVID